jgi:hypothetical protein
MAKPYAPFRPTGLAQVFPVLVTGHNPWSSAKQRHAAQIKNEVLWYLVGRIQNMQQTAAHPSEANLAPHRASRFYPLRMED